MSQISEVTRWNENCSDIYQALTNEELRIGAVFYQDFQMQSNVLDSPCDKHRAICLAVDINVSMLPLINFKKESRERYLIQL